jgi:ketosteroid isomerase-like protein
MSQEENIGIARAAIDAYNKGDLEGALKGAAPGFEMDLSRAMGPDQRGVYGRDQMTQFWTEFAKGWESVRIEPQDFIAAGDQVVVPWTMRAVGRDGIEVQARVTWIFTIRDGAIHRVSMYQALDEALEAAGLKE